MKNDLKKFDFKKLNDFLEEANEDLSRFSLFASFTSNGMCLFKCYVDEEDFQDILSNVNPELIKHHDGDVLILDSNSNLIEIQIDRKEILDRHDEAHAIVDKMFEDINFDEID